MRIYAVTHPGRLKLKVASSMAATWEQSVGTRVELRRLRAITSSSGRAAKFSRKNAVGTRAQQSPTALKDVFGPKMAFLAYLLMIATLMTSAFIGYEWVATSSMPRVTSEHARIVKQESRTRQTAARLAAAKLAASRVADSSANEPSDAPRTGHPTHVRPKHLRIASKHANGVTTEASLGFGYAPASSLFDRDRRE
jgi:hypothetical protein